MYSNPTSYWSSAPEGPTIWLLRGIWVISEKKYPADWFRGKKFLHGNIIPGEKRFLHWKNYLSWRMTLEKNLTARPLYVRKKNSITSGFGGKILSPPNHPYHSRNPTHSPSMSNGRLFLLFLCCSAPLFLVFLMFPCSCAPPVWYPASIACERQTFLLAHPRQRQWTRRNVCRSQATASRVTSPSLPPPSPPL